MFTIRKTFKFEGAHILSSCYSKECKNIHGHSYKVEVFISSEILNEDGMVIDFKELKEAVNPIIQNWDHALLVPIPLYPSIVNSGLKVLSTTFNPTAENMARYFFNMIHDLLKVSQRKLILKVRVHETETGWAEYYE